MAAGVPVPIDKSLFASFSSEKEESFLPFLSYPRAFSARPETRCRAENALEHFQPDWKYNAVLKML